VDEIGYLHQADAGDNNFLALGLGPERVGERRGHGDPVLLKQLFPALQNHFGAGVLIVSIWLYLGICASLSLKIGLFWIIWRRDMGGINDLMNSGKKQSMARGFRAK